LFYSFIGQHDFAGDARDGDTHRQAGGRALRRPGLGEPSDGWQHQSSTMILGHSLTHVTGGAWKYFAPFLGTLGSFFSGSTTISNLTFGGIQASIAHDVGTDPGILLALQCAGAAMGNILAIHNIVAGCALLMLANVEGKILKEAFPWWFMRD
jgi:L-lactate permease